MLVMDKFYARWAILSDSHWEKGLAQLSAFHAVARNLVCTTQTRNCSLGGKLHV